MADRTTRGAAGALALAVALLVTVGAAAAGAAPSPAAAPDRATRSERSPGTGGPVARVGRAAGKVIRDRELSGGERLREARAGEGGRAECAGCAGDDGGLARLGWRLSALAASGVGVGD